MKNKISYLQDMTTNINKGTSPIFYQQKIVNISYNVIVKLEKIHHEIT
jgi:hypothetical protein